MTSKSPKQGRVSRVRRAVSPALKTYRKKRDFAQTAEPSGNEAVTGGGHIFTVQKHAASHLHYDFRLEMDGVLRSWAVAKGPSVDPAVKRLAIEVEDHPLAYGDFEGTIPEGQYGGGTVMLWDQGTWSPEADPHKAYRAGRMKFELHGAKMKGLWALVRMKPRPKDRHPNWLLIKDKDANAAPGDADKLLRQDKSVKTRRSMDAISKGGAVWPSKTTKAKSASSKKAPLKKSGRVKTSKKTLVLPDFIEPALATRVDAAPEGDNWLHEIKFDGYRLHCRLEDGAARILTRHGEDWTAKFKDLAADMEALPVDNAYIDGEAMILDRAGLSDFSALQTWFKAPGQNVVVFYGFDLLFLDGEDLREKPLTARKAQLERLLKKSKSKNIRYSDHQTGHGAAFFKTAVNLGVEGIISKIADAPYASGRARDWLKIKRIERQEFVIGGFTKSKKHAGSIGSLLLGEYQNKTLVYVGKVGTGFTDATSISLMKTLSKIAAKDAPFPDVPSDVQRAATWVKPKLVAEVEFGAWTADHILRHAAFMGLRDDKTPKDVTAEKVMSVAAVNQTHKPLQRSSRKPSTTKTSDSDAVLGVGITHPERLIYRTEHITKLDVAQYYEGVADVMLPHVAERPLSLVRCPDGVGPACFFQKHAGAGLPEGIREERIGSGKADLVLTVDSAEGLVSLVQRGVLEVHTWGSHLDHVEKPDMIVFDFDPDTMLKWPAVVKAAVDMRAALKKIGLTSFVKTTGGKGLHVVVPIAPRLDWDGIKQFSKSFAAKFVAADPETYVLTMAMKARKGRIFVDYLRNGRGATAVAPYSTRARPGARIAMPLSWDDLEGGAKPEDFTMASVLKRLSGRFKDPWAKIESARQEITVKMIESLSD